MVHTTVAVFGTPETVAIPQVYDQPMAEIWERDAHELAEGVRRGRALGSGFARRLPRADRALRPGAQRVLLPRRRACARVSAREIDDARRARRGPRTLGRRADGRQGAREGRRVARHARVAALRRTTSRPRDGTEAGAAAGGGRGARRAHDVTRVRVDELDPHLPARHHAQSVEPRAHARRFVGRVGGRGRRRA